MKTYWDHTVVERSKMTAEEVEGHLKLELMVKGVPIPQAPILKPITQVDLRSEQYYELGGIYFKTPEQAQKFIELNPMKEAYDYECGYNNKYAEPITDRVIERRMLYNHQDILNSKMALQKNKEAQEYNASVESDFSKAVKAMDEVTKGVWADWYSCLDLAKKYAKIVATRDEYLKMTGEDSELALSFLKKIYSDTDIEDSLKWLSQ